MSLSIIIPTLNEARFLPKLLASINNQSVLPDEIIVADGGSIDGTQEIAEKFGAKVVSGGTPSSGRNHGAAAATESLILFLDADTQLTDNNFLEKSIVSFNDQQLDIATADVYPKDGNFFDKLSHKMYNLYVRMWGKTFPHAPGFCILIKKSLHDRIGGFDESISFCEDHEYAQRAAKKGKFGFLSDVVIPVSVRRMEKDGRFVIVIKYFLAELHILFFGPIRGNKFNYTFEHLGTDYGKRDHGK